RSGRRARGPRARPARSPARRAGRARPPATTTAPTVRSSGRRSGGRSGASGTARRGTARPAPTAPSRRGHRGGAARRRRCRSRRTRASRRSPLPQPRRDVSLSPMDFEHVLVVGAGQMGGGIAQVVAASGRRVSLHDAAPGATERGLGAMRRSLEKLAEKGGADPDEVLARVEPVDDLVPADLMVEAVVEDAEIKADVFRRADGTLPEGAIL